VSLISSRRSPHLRPAGTYFSSFCVNQLFYNGSIINSGCEIKNDKNTLRLWQINHLGAQRLLRNAENRINARAYIYTSKAKAAKEYFTHVPFNNGGGAPLPYLDLCEQSSFCHREIIFLSF